jgi:hypothetical protein
MYPLQPEYLTLTEINLQQVDNTGRQQQYFCVLLYATNQDLSPIRLNQSVLIPAGRNSDLRDVKPL